MIWTWVAGTWAGQALAPALYLRRRPHAELARPELALTFDDGPDPRYTPRVLEILDRYAVPAAFFLVGRKAERHPDCVQAIGQAGHDVGNHSYAHIPPWFQSPLAAYRDHMQANAAIADAVGHVPAFARAPWGFPNAGGWWAVRRSRQTYVHWTVHACDWRPGITPAEICQRVVSRAAPGGIVLLHDGAGYPGDPSSMLEALPRLIVDLRERFRFVRLRAGQTSATGQEEMRDDVDTLHLGSA